MSEQIDDSRLPASPIPGFEYPNGGIEYPQYGFTRRERAAIDLRLPDSGTPWLDDMIRAAQRQWLAAQALAGMLADPNNNGHYTDNAAASYKFADAMLVVQKGGPQ